MERMQIVIAGGPDPAERRFQFFGAVQRCAVTERKGRHPVRAHRVQSTISVPSAGIFPPPRPPILRPAGACRRAAVGLFLCRKKLLPGLKPARAWVAPRAPPIAIYR